MGRAIGMILFGFLAVILMTVGVSTISGQNGVQISGVRMVAASENAPVADYIVIGGKLSDQASGDWLNGYAIIPYEDGIEVTTPQTRVFTKTGEHPYSGEGVHDGFFLIKIPNRYKLTTKNVFYNANNEPVEMRYVANGVMGSSELFIWLSEVHPGQIFCLDVPDKQLEFAVAAMPVDNTHLPEDIRQSSTVFLGNGRIQAMHINQPNGSNVSFLVTEGVSNREILSVLWTREFTAPETKSLEAVYQEYVFPTTPEMSIEQFRSQVSDYNANLGSNQMFLSGQTYYLPLSSSS